MTKSMIVVFLLLGMSAGTSILAAYKIMTMPEANNSQPVAVSAGVSSEGKQAAVAGTTDNRCLVTLSGQLYDVSRLKNSHSGGDIFVCGTDMTTAYRQEHGNDLAQMRAYLVSRSTVNNNATTDSNTINQITNKEKEIAREEAKKRAEDEREDEKD